MGVLDAMRALFGRRGSPGSSGESVVVYQVRAQSILGMGPEEMYRKQPHLRAVISFLADNVADVPLKCYVREDDTSRPRDTTSPLAMLLANPSPTITQFEYIRAITSDILLYENALAVVVPSERASSGWMLRHIPWSWVTAGRTSDGFEPSSYDVYNPYTRGHATFDAEDCIRYSSYNPGGNMPDDYGHSTRIDALRQILYEQVSAWNFRNSVWRNGGRVTQYLTRPATAARWEPADRARFAKSWKEKFAGEDGTNTGGTPLLEDGMELKAVPFNARESQFVEATQISREDVAAVYHINPSVIWHSGTQTYASARDNARALYSEALSPIFTMIQQRHNAILVPKLGLDSSHYCEFDLSSKLAASFEEQASVLQSSVGGPWMLRNEARARMNLPAIPGGDELIVPLNVVEGGLASPNDTDPTKGVPVPAAQVAPDMINAFTKAFAEAIVLAARQIQQPSKTLSEGEDRQSGPFGGAARELRVRVKNRAITSMTHDLENVLRKFYERQAVSLANQLSRMDPEDINTSGYMEWWNKSRWKRELADDLESALRPAAILRAEETMWELCGGDFSTFNEGIVTRRVAGICSQRADDILQSTMLKLASAIDGLEEKTPDSVRECVTEQFEALMDSRVKRSASSIVTATYNMSIHEGARQSKVECQKEWVASKINTRSSHIRLDGERVPLASTFSNGARWPGDPHLTPQETCNCRCRLEIISGKDRADGKELRGYREDVAKADKELNKARAEYQRNKTPAHFQETIGKVVESYATNGSITAEWKTNPLGKELVSAMMCSANGHDVCFFYTQGDGSHPDIKLDGIICEFKRPESFVPNAVYTLMKKARHQGAQRIVVDLALDRIKLLDAISEATRAIDDGVMQRGSVFILDRHGNEHIV